MSYSTSLGVTVSPDVGPYFLRFLKGLSRESPDMVYRKEDGAVSAVWQNRNHFDAGSSSDYRSIMEFLDNMGTENYIYESVTEDEEPEIGGGYYFGFARVTRYEVEGRPVDLNSVVVSQNRKKRGLFGRH